MPQTQDYWFQSAILLAVLAGLCYLYSGTATPRAHAAGGGWDTDGVMAVTINPTERLVVVDTTKKNICVYRLLGAGFFGLVGARGYQYDVELKDSTGTAIMKNGLTYLETKALYDKLEKERIK